MLSNTVSNSPRTPKHSSPPNSNGKEMPPATLGEPADDPYPAIAPALYMIMAAIKASPPNIDKEGHRP